MSSQVSCFNGEPFISCSMILYVLVFCYINSIMCLLQGSSRSSGILGEATLNLAAFLSFDSPTLVSMPLKNCKHGTILQVSRL